MAVVFNFINLSACLHCKSTQIRPHNPVLQDLFGPILDPSVAEGAAHIFFFMYSRGVQILKCSEDLRHHQHGNCRLGPCTGAAVFGHRWFSGTLGKKHLRRASVATGGHVRKRGQTGEFVSYLESHKKKKNKRKTPALSALKTVGLVLSRGRNWSSCAKHFHLHFMSSVRVRE